jgi:hypothetical protein
MNTRSYRGKAAVFVAAILVTLAAAKVSLARQNSSPFDGSNAQASRLGLGEAAASSDARFRDSNPNLLQTGTVTSLGPTKCPPGAASGASCKRIRHLSG